MDENKRTTRSKKIIMGKIIVILLFISTVAVGQDNISIFREINKARAKQGLPELQYRSVTQRQVDDKVADLLYNFELSDECDCDYESIAGDHTIPLLIRKLTNNRRYGWYHFERDIRFVTISVNSNRGIVYCVIRAYNE
jgi:hypothetical protein